MNEPFGLCRGPDGALFLCDTNNHRVRKIDAKGIITTVAGDGTKGYAGDGDAARHALFREVRIESGLPQGSDVRPR